MLNATDIHVKAGARDRSGPALDALRLSSTRREKKRMIKHDESEDG
jgi:hypothetical protein